MDLKLKGKTAFISGSTSGIGFATAQVLLKEGMKVYINGRTQNSVEIALKKLEKAVPKAEVFGVAADFSEEKELKKIQTAIPNVDVLINNVGIYTSSSFFDTSTATWQEQFQVNVMSGVALSKFYIKGMLERNWGRVFFLSSECAYIVPTDLISYSATKASLHAISRGLAQLTKGTGVTSNVVVPGSTLSEGAQRFLKEKATEEKTTPQEVEVNFFKTERTQSLLQRFATVEEVATTIAYYSSPLAVATNGAIIKVDGGSSGGAL